MFVFSPGWAMEEEKSSILGKRSEREEGSSDTEEREPKQRRMELVDCAPDSASRNNSEIVWHNYCCDPQSNQLYCGDEVCAWIAPEWLPHICSACAQLYSSYSSDEESYGEDFISSPTECFLGDLFQSSKFMGIPELILQIVHLLSSDDRKNVSQVSKKFKQIVDYATTHLKLKCPEELDDSYSYARKGEDTLAFVKFSYVEYNLIPGSHWLIRFLDYTPHRMQFMSLAAFPQLTSLSPDHTIADETLFGLPYLRSLKLSKMGIQDTILSQLTNLTRLSLPPSYSLGSNEITDQGLSPLSHLTRLTIKYNQRFTDNSVSRLTQLRRLTLGGINEEGNTKKITDEGLSHLINLTALHYWEWEDADHETYITDNSLSYLANLTCLKLGGARHITEKSLYTLSNLTHLKLRRDKQSISKNSITRLTTLKRLALQECNHDNEGLAPLTGITRLSLVDMSASIGNDGISNDGISSLTNLVSLRLLGTREVKLQCVGGLTNLTKLVIEIHKEECYDPIYTLTNLRTLKLVHSDEIDFKQCLALPNLEKLYVFKSQKPEEMLQFAQSIAELLEENPEGDTQDVK